MNKDFVDQVAVVVEREEERVELVASNKMTRPPYKTPSKATRREGADDYQAWPSKGGD